LEGLPTTRDLHLDILRHPSFVEGRYSTGFLDQSMEELSALA
jgi:biotin carboxylase